MDGVNMTDADVKRLEEDWEKKRREEQKKAQRRPRRAAAATATTASDFKNSYSWTEKLNMGAEHGC